MNTHEQKTNLPINHNDEFSALPSSSKSEINEKKSAVDEEIRKTWKEVDTIENEKSLHNLFKRLNLENAGLFDLPVIQRICKLLDHDLEDTTIKPYQKLFELDTKGKMPADYVTFNLNIEPDENGKWPKQDLLLSYLDQLHSKYRTILSKVFDIALGGNFTNLEYIYKKTIENFAIHYLETTEKQAVKIINDDNILISIICITNKYYLCRKKLHDQLNFKSAELIDNSNITKYIDDNKNKWPWSTQENLYKRVDQDLVKIFAEQYSAFSLSFPLSNAYITKQVNDGFFFFNRYISEEERVKKRNKTNYKLHMPIKNDALPKIWNLFLKNFVLSNLVTCKIAIPSIIASTKEEETKETPKVNINSNQDNYLGKKLCIYSDNYNTENSQPIWRSFFKHLNADLQQKYSLDNLYEKIPLADFPYHPKRCSVLFFGLRNDNTGINTNDYIAAENAYQSVYEKIMEFPEDAAKFLSLDKDKQDKSIKWYTSGLAKTKCPFLSDIKEPNHSEETCFIL